MVSLAEGLAGRVHKRIHPRLERGGDAAARGHQGLRALDGRDLLLAQSEDAVGSKLEPQVGDRFRQLRAQSRRDPRQQIHKLNAGAFEGVTEQAHLVEAGRLRPEQQVAEGRARQALCIQERSLNAGRAAKEPRVDVRIPSHDIAHQQDRRLQGLLHALAQGEQPFALVLEGDTEPCLLLQRQGQIPQVCRQLGRQTGDLRNPVAAGRMQVAQPLGLAGQGAQVTVDQGDLALPRIGVLCGQQCRSAVLQPLAHPCQDQGRIGRRQLALHHGRHPGTGFQQRHQRHGARKRDRQRGKAQDQQQTGLDAGEHRVDPGATGSRRGGHLWRCQTKAPPHASIEGSVLSPVKNEVISTQLNKTAVTQGELDYRHVLFQESFQVVVPQIAGRDQQ
jgi:hypothetical protein